MDINKYKTLSRIGCTPMESMNICIKEMITKGIILENYTVKELLELCYEFKQAQREHYDLNKAKQNYYRILE